MQASVPEQGVDVRMLDIRIDEVRAQRVALAALLDEVRAALAGGLPAVEPRCWASPAAQGYGLRLAEVTASLGRADRRLDEADAALRQHEWRLERERDVAIANGDPHGGQLSVFTREYRWRLHG